jgi:carbamoyl-phosphate synthase large subunit
MDLARAGVLERYGVEMIGARADAIAVAEDRDLFKAAMIEIGLEVPRSAAAHSLDEARSVLRMVGLPAIIRLRSRWAVVAAASPTTARISTRW